MNGKKAKALRKLEGWPGRQHAKALGPANTHTPTLAHREGSFRQNYQASKSRMGVNGDGRATAAWRALRKQEKETAHDSPAIAR